MMVRLRRAEVMLIQVRTYAHQEKTTSVHKTPVHNLNEENNPKCQVGQEPPIAGLSHMVHRRRTAETPDQSKVTSKVKTFLGKLGLLKEKQRDEPSKRSYSTKREEAEKVQPSNQVDKYAWTPAMAGMKIPPAAAGPHATAGFDRDLLRAEALTYIKKQQALHRPMSPHMTIYAPQWTWVPSITHRITGVALTTSLYGLGIGYMFADHSFPYYVHVVQSLHIPGVLLFTVKLGIAYAASFHTINGIRHLIWDTGRGLELKKVDRTAQIVVALSALCAVGLAIL